jgi:hypothetical protein
MNAIPLDAVPNQTLQVVLASQSVQINLYQTPGGLFMDVLVNNAPIKYGQICENLNRIIRTAYLGFVGDFIFQDTQGSNDPDYTGLGSRYVLYYLSAAEAGDS